jgi:hypothetical protein
MMKGPFKHSYGMFPRVGNMLIAILAGDRVPIPTSTFGAGSRHVITCVGETVNRWRAHRGRRKCIGCRPCQIGSATLLVAQPPPSHYGCGNVGGRTQPVQHARAGLTRRAFTGVHYKRCCGARSKSAGVHCLTSGGAAVLPWRIHQARPLPLARAAFWRLH